MINTKAIKKISQVLKLLIANRLQGSSNLYILVILFVVCLISYLLVGGFFPHLNKKPLNPQSVRIGDASSSGKINTLQLVNLQIASDSSDINSGE